LAEAVAQVSRDEAAANPATSAPTVNVNAMSMNANANANGPASSLANVLALANGAPSGRVPPTQNDEMKSSAVSTPLAMPGSPTSVAGAMSGVGPTQADDDGESASRRHRPMTILITAAV